MNRSLLLSLALLGSACAHPASPIQPGPATAPAITPAELQALRRQAAVSDALRNDWANLARYRAANAALPAPAPGERRVVFMGNSITDGWAKFFPAMFPGKPYIGRGISGQ